MGAAAARRLGRQTLSLESRPALVAVASAVGPMEGQGPLGRFFDVVEPDGLLGQASWERAEVKLLEEALDLACRKARLDKSELDVVIGGDLLNQLGAASFAARSHDRAFLGVFGACSTWTEGLALAGALADGGYVRRAGVVCSSHHDAAERQFRFPTEFAHQRPPTSTWTATGAAAAIVAAPDDAPASRSTPRLRYATLGRVVDVGEKNPYDLGSAMAPAAADTILAHLRDTGRRWSDYDLVVTGDLGRVGHPIAADLLSEAGISPDERFQDCGVLLYDPKQDVHAGGSGCACSAVTFAGYLYRGLAEGRWRRVLLVSTGALFSPTTYQQGESIPGIAHAVAVEREDEA
ncbi:MAG: stage V sporulation protein AD [Clostridia bacterium]|nr:stage V sporulation protein AD [Clostridia bacterium]